MKHNNKYFPNWQGEYSYYYWECQGCGGRSHQDTQTRLYVTTIPDDKEQNKQKVHYLSENCDEAIEQIKVINATRLLGL